MSNPDINELTGDPVVQFLSIFDLYLHMSNGDFDNSFDSSFEYFDFCVCSFEDILNRDSTLESDKHYGLQVLGILKDAKSLAVNQSNLFNTYGSDSRLKSLMFSLNEGLKIALYTFSQIKNMDIMLRHLGSTTELFEASVMRESYLQIPLIRRIRAFFALLTAKPFRHRNIFHQFHQFHQSNNSTNKE